MNHLSNYTNKLRNDLEKKLKAKIAQYKIPGIALGIIENNNIITLTDGVCEINNQKLITNNSIFPIASVSKTFLATITAEYVNQGLLNWDDTIQKHLPDFKVTDPYVSNNLTIRDLLSHTSGLESSNLLWYLTDYSANDLMKQISYLPCKTTFRSHFEYNNFGPLIVSKVLEKITGISWDILYTILQKNLT